MSNKHHSLFILIVFLLVACVPLPQPEPTSQPAIAPSPPAPSDAPPPPNPGVIPIESTPLVTPPPEMPNVAVLFMVDSSESVRKLCSDEQQEMLWKVPSLTTSFLMGLSYNSGNSNKLEIGVVGFTSLVDTKTPFPLRSVIEYYDHDVSAEYRAYLKGFNDLGNNFSKALLDGKEILENSSARKKILVLITDGWFIDYTLRGREPTRNAIIDLKKNGIEILVIRLVCDIKVGLYPSHSVAVQSLDNDFWKSTITPTYNTLTDYMYTADTNSVIKNLIGHKLFQDLLPKSSLTGWWAAADGISSSIQWPGENFRMDFSFATLGVSSIKFDSRLDSRNFTKLGSGAFVATLVANGANVSCDTSTYSLEPIESSKDAIIFYWWVPEDIQNYFNNLSVEVQNNNLYNNEAINLKLVNLFNDIPRNTIESFAPCFEVWVSMVRATDNYTVAQKKLTLSDILDNSSISVDIPVDNRSESLHMFVDLVKYPKQCEPFISVGRYSETILMSFRPAINTSSISCGGDQGDEKCSVIVQLDYFDAKDYPTGTGKSTQVWTFTKTSYNEFNEMDPKSEPAITCNGRYPHKPSTEVAGESQTLYAVALFGPAATYSDKNVFFSQAGDELIFEISKTLIDNCGFNFIVFSWKNQDSKMIKCSLETEGHCEAIPYFEIKY
jgi:hypothetical protein